MKKIQSPSQFIKNICKVYKGDIVAFLSIISLGVMVHLYVMTNKFFNYFEMGNILSDMSYMQNDTLGLGRWFLPIASNIISSFSVPSVNGFIFLGYMGVSAILILKMLKIENLLYKILFGAVWITFPGMAASFAFGVNVDAIGCSIFLAVLSVYISEYSKKGILIGSLILACSLGVYQPFFAIAIGIVYCIIFVEALDREFKVKVFLKKLLRRVLFLLLGFIEYYVILQIFLAVFSTELTEYHGINEMTSFTLKGIAKGFVYSYGYFFASFFNKDYVYTNIGVLLSVIGVVVFVIMLFCARKGKTWNGKMWSAVLLVFLPLGLNSAPFLMADRVGNGVDRYMMFSLMFLWLLFLWFIEKIKINEMIQWCTVLLIVLVSIGGFSTCNQAYHRMDAMTTTTNFMLNRIVARIEMLPGWNLEMPVYFVNPKELVNQNYAVEIAKYKELTNIPGTEIKPSYSEKAIVNYLEVYLHFPVQTLTDEEKRKIDENKLIQNMPAYPAEDAIQIVDGVIIVKISGGV